jgi:hypothetical protein
VGTWWDWSAEHLVGVILATAALVVAVPTIWTKGVVALFQLLKLLVNLPDMIADAQHKLTFVYDQCDPSNEGGMNARLAKHIDDHDLHKPKGTM